MFQILRNAAQTWVAKLLFGLLIVAFGVWGVSREILGGAGSSTVVTVGDQKIDLPEFHLLYRQQLSEVSRRFRTQITPDQARMMGLDRAALSQATQGAALDQLADDLDLGLSKDKLAQLIANDPSFKGLNGQFDRQLFTRLLQQSQISEKVFIDLRSKEAVRSQIVDALSTGFVAPKTVTDALKQYTTESRSIDYLLLTNANIDPVKAPAEDVLAKWYDGVKARYRAPEYRKIGYLHLEAADIADPASVTDFDIKTEFDKSKASFTTPAQRTIEQLSFANKELADAAETALRTGTTFDQLVKDQGKTPTDVLLGEFTKDAVPDPAIADAAFAVKADGGTSPVVQGSLGPVILRITNIKPESTRTLAEVQDEIRRQLAVTKAAQQLSSLRDHIDDMRASGSSFDQIAAEVKAKAAVVNAVDQSGNDESGAPVKDLPAAQQLVTEAFRTEVGAQPSPLPVGNTGYVWFEVLNVSPERDRTLAEVHDKAVADWTAEQQKADLAKKTQELLQQAKGGKSLVDIAAPMGIEVNTKTAITRATADQVLGQAGVSAAFSGPVDTVASAVGGDPATQILLKVTDVNTQPPADALTNQDQQIQAFANGAVDDMFNQMVNLLQTEYGAAVNQQAFEQAVTR